MNSLDDVKKMLKSILKNHHLFQAGKYFVSVFYNKIGTVFEIERKEEYYYREDIDFEIRLKEVLFFYKSPELSCFKNPVYYYHSFFYGTSEDLDENINILDIVERVSFDKYRKAKEFGLLIKKERASSFL